MKNRARKFWNFVENSDSAELRLYGPISESTWCDDEVTPNTFAEDLAGCENKPLIIRINSGGGDVFAANAIYNLLRAYKADKTVYIDGLCASAATIVACAGDTVIMPANAIYMIHPPSVSMYGDYTGEDLSKMANALETVGESIKNVYRMRCGDKSDEVEALMDAETYLTASQALDLGLVDSVDDAMDLDAVVNKSGIFVNRIRLDARDAGKARQFINQGGIKTVDKNNDLLQKIKELLGIKEGDKGAQPAADEDTAGTDEPAAPDEDPDEEEKTTVEEAVKNERKRVSALNAMKTGNSVVDSIINTAIAEGTEASTVKAFINAVKAPVEKQEADMKAVNAIKQLVSDSLTSGVNGVAPSKVADTIAKEDESKKKAIDEIVSIANGDDK